MNRYVEFLNFEFKFYCTYIYTIKGDCFYSFITLEVKKSIVFNGIDFTKRGGNDN